MVCSWGDHDELRQIDYLYKKTADEEPIKLWTVTINEDRNDRVFEHGLHDAYRLRLTAVHLRSYVNRHELRLSGVDYDDEGLYSCNMTIYAAENYYQFYRLRDFKPLDVIRKIFIILCFLLIIGIKIL